MSSPAQVFDLDDMQFSPTAWLFEGAKHGGAGVSMFIVRTPPGGGVVRPVHPDHETFLVREGEGRWTAGDDAVELRPNQMLVVPPETPHGFRHTRGGQLLVRSGLSARERQSAF